MKKDVDKKDISRIEYRPCVVSVPDLEEFLKKVNIKFGDDRVFKMPTRKVKALFHCYHPITGRAFVEYEDGTVHEVFQTQIRFVDREIKNYAFCVDEKELKEDGRQSSCVNS